MLPNPKLLLLFFLFSLISLNAQKTVFFNGKNYMVYPQSLETYNTNVGYNENTLTLTGVDFPPVIGSVKDGEYLIYTRRFSLVSKGRKSRLFDTVYQVYGTFTVRDNRKEGNALVYKMFEQNRVLAAIPYKNDLVDGEIKIYIERDRNTSRKQRKRDRDNYDEGAFFYKKYKQGKPIDYTGKYYRLNYTEGILNGQVRYYIVSPGDTLLTQDFMVKNSYRDGGYVGGWYYRNGKKILKYYETRGQYKNDKKEGEWIEHHYYWGYIQKEYYIEDTLRHEKNLSPEGKMYYMKSYGRDSVIRYAPNYRSEEKVPCPEYGEYGTRLADFVEFRLTGDSLVLAYLIDHYASRSFYSSYRIFRDTMISGQLFRFLANGYGENMERWYAIDTCWNYINGISEREINFCEDLLWTKRYDKKDRLLTFIKEEAFDQYDYRDSLKPELRETIINKNSITEKFYQKALNYHFSNYTFTKGKNIGCRLYYDVNGGYKTGSVIRYIRIPSAYDTITLIDTLMQNGKFMNNHDGYFMQGYINLLNNGRDADKEWSDMSFFNETIHSFFSLSPVQHKTILLGNKLFTGNLDLKIAYDKHQAMAKAMVYEVESMFQFISKKLIIEIGIVLDIDKLYAGPSYAFIIPSSVESFELEAGVFNGSLDFLDIFGRRAVGAYYSNNLLNSRVDYNAYRRLMPNSDDFHNMPEEVDEYARIKADMIYPVKGSSMQYRDGLKEGQWMMIDYYGHMSEQLMFHKGRKNGLQLNYADDESYPYLAYLYHSVNDTVNGEVWKSGINGLPDYHGYFNMGVPHGFFTSYFTDDTSRYFMQRFHFDSGFLTGNYLQYRDSDNLALSISFQKNDSMQFSVFDNESEYLEYAWDMTYLGDFSGLIYAQGDFSGLRFTDMLFQRIYVPELAFKHGVYSYYYKSSGLFSRGVKEYERPVGEWKFYREGRDRIYKEINFKDSFLLEGNDTLKTFGQVKAYYDDGRLMFRAYATDQSSAYSCESEADMPVEEDYYLEFYDTLGKPVLVDGNGFIRELQANGYVLKEGKMENYRKQGIWIYYTKFGLPEAIGVYKDGKKMGRWLRGDLGGLNLDDRICYMSNEEFKAWINTFGGNLNLTEEYYVDGELISSNTVATIKR